MSLRFCIPMVLLAFATFAKSEAQAANPVEIARGVDAHYNSLRSLKSEFTEVYQAPGLSRTESGTMWLKKPARMRWEYRVPRAKLFITDSENAYFYVAGESLARKASIKKIDDIRSPLRFLLGKTKLEKELNGLSLAPDVPALQAGDVVLRGIPKGMQDRVSEVILEVSPAHQFTRIVILGADGSNTDFRFSQIEENIPVSDSFFRFSPPPGVPVIRDDNTAE